METAMNEPLDVPEHEEPKQEPEGEPESEASTSSANDDSCFKTPLLPSKRGKRGGRGSSNISIVHSPAARRNGHLSEGIQRGSKTVNKSGLPNHKSTRGGSQRGSRGGLHKRLPRADGIPTGTVRSAFGPRKPRGSAAKQLARQEASQNSEEGQNSVSAIAPVRKSHRYRMNGRFGFRTRVGARVAARLAQARQNALEKTKKGRGKKAFDLALKKSKRGLGLKAGELMDAANGPIADIPPPPRLTFVKHDMFCTMTHGYLDKLTNLPKFATIPKWLHNWIDYKKKHLAGRWQAKARKRIEKLKRERRKKRTEEERKNKEVKREDAEMKDADALNTDKVKMEIQSLEQEPKNENIPIDESFCPALDSGSKGNSKKSKLTKAPLYNWVDEKIPFVQEIILDEYSVLGFTCMKDQRVFDEEVETLREAELETLKARKAEKTRRQAALRKKIKLRRYVILKYQRLARKRQRVEKRERQIAERNAKYDTLKKLVKEAIEKGEFSEELRTQWVHIREKRKKRREERQKRKAEHEARKEARRASRPRRRNGKKRAKERRKKRERAARIRASSAARMMKSPGLAASAAGIVGAPLPPVVAAALPQMPLNGAASMPTMLGEKRPASGHPGPSPSPIKSVKLDPEIYKNGIIGIAKSSSGTPPVVRTPLSHESVKPHTTSAESSHPSDPGHRIASARATPLSSLAPPSAASLFINTNAGGGPASAQPTAELLQQLAAAAAAQGSHPGAAIDPLRLLNGHPALAGLTAGGLTAGANPFLAAAAASNAAGPAGLGLFNPQMFLQTQQLQQQAAAAQSNQQASAMIQQAALNAAVAQQLPAGLHGLQFPPGAALGSQLAGAALLGHHNGAAPPPKKPGRWCGMHVKIANQIDEDRKQRAKQQQVQQSQSMASHLVPSSSQLAQSSSSSTASSHPPPAASTSSSSTATDPAFSRLAPPADIAQLLHVAQQQHAAQQHLLAAANRSALLAAAGQPTQASAPQLLGASSAATQQPHCLPSTSTAQQQGLPLSFPSGLLAGLPFAQAQANAHMMNAALQEASRRVTATPKPGQTPTLMSQQQQQQQAVAGARPSSVMSRGPSSAAPPGSTPNFPAPPTSAGLSAGIPGLPPGFHLGPNGLALPPPAAGASLTNGTSDAAAQQAFLQAALLQHHQHQAHQLNQHNQQQAAVAEQQRREQAQRDQQLHAQQQQAAQMQAHQQLLAAAGGSAGQALGRASLPDPNNTAALLQQMQMLQQLGNGNPAQTLHLIAQLQAAQQQQPHISAASVSAPNGPSTQAPPTSSQISQSQMDLIRAQLEQQHHNQQSVVSQPNHLLMAHAVQQQQAAQSQAQSQAGLDRETLMRMYAGQQQQLPTTSSATSATGRPAVFEALLALQNASQAQGAGARLGLPTSLPGLPNLPGLSSAAPISSISTGSIPSSLASSASQQPASAVQNGQAGGGLFTPLLGLPGLNPSNFMGQKLPFSASLQQLVQMKQNELAPPGGR